MRKVYAEYCKESKCNKTCCTQKIVAVTDLCFGVALGETFALIGVNGAGKTTTFKSLINEVRPSNGRVSVNGLDVAHNFG